MVQAESLPWLSSPEISTYIWVTKFRHSRRLQRSHTAGGINHAPADLASRVVFALFPSSLSIFTSACLPPHANTPQQADCVCRPSSDFCSPLLPGPSLGPSLSLSRGPFQLWVSFFSPDSYPPLYILPYSTLFGDVFEFCILILHKHVFTVRYLSVSSWDHLNPMSAKMRRRTLSPPFFTSSNMTQPHT